MAKSFVFGHIRLDDQSATPKYQQLASSIIDAIKSGKIVKDEILPSINELSYEFEISRDTAEKGYRVLKKMGVLGSVPGKGYFIKNTQIDHELKIFLLFNNLSLHKKIIYDALVNSLEEHAAIDFYIYNNDFSLFKKLLQNRKNDYTHYVIIPHFTEGGENANEIMNTIDKSKLIVLDKLIPGIRGNYGAVFENFEKDISHALEQALPQLIKYHTLKIIFPDQSYYPEEILNGFYHFCRKFGFGYKVVHNIAKEQIQEGDVYINLMDNDLVILIERLISEKRNVGKEVGVISYNETPLKKIILNGITTISTDFQLMGEKAAEMILTNTRRHLEVPFSLTLRESL